MAVAGSLANLSIFDHNGEILPRTNPQLGKCLAALDRRQRRSSTLPPLRIDPLSPLPLADAARPAPAVHFVFFIMASRSYAHETIKRNVRALQHPGALAQPGTNQSNLFIVHVDAKMASEDRATLLAEMPLSPDLYVVRNPRHVMWAGFSMVMALLDTLGSLVSRKLHFEYVINLSDADLSLRTDGELRAFFARFPGRSIMSIVSRTRDPRRYKQHEGFRRFCWTECDGGSAWVVGLPAGGAIDASKVIGKRKCCWSRSAPILYTRTPISCTNNALPPVFHGSQWASLHRDLVHHLVRHTLSQRVTSYMEHTLLPDEAMLQTATVNSRFRSTIIGTHLRFIEWPQMHGDANKYWASLGPRFHGGPMVLNETLLVHKAFLTSAMFARKVDPTVYPEVMPLWDEWMRVKLQSQAVGARQPEVANSQTHLDPTLSSAIPKPTYHDTDAAVPETFTSIGWPNEADVSSMPSTGGNGFAIGAGSIAENPSRKSNFWDILPAELSAKSDAVGSARPIVGAAEGDGAVAGAGGATGAGGSEGSSRPAGGAAEVSGGGVAAVAGSVISSSAVSDSDGGAGTMGAREGPLTDHNGGRSISSSTSSSTTTGTSSRTNADGVNHQTDEREAAERSSTGSSSSEPAQADDNRLISVKGLALCSASIVLILLYLRVRMRNSIRPRPDGLKDF